MDKIKNLYKFDVVQSGETQRVEGYLAKVNFGEEERTVGFSYAIQTSTESDAVAVIVIHDIDTGGWLGEKKLSFAETFLIAVNNDFRKVIGYTIGLFKKEMEDNTFRCEEKLLVERAKKENKVTGRIIIKPKKIEGES